MQSIKLAFKSLIDSLHLTDRQFFGLIAGVLLVVMTIKIFLTSPKKGETPPASETEPEKPAAAKGEDLIMHLSFLIRPNGTLVDDLLKHERDQYFREAFHLLLQYHILKADVCRHNAQLDEGDHWLAYACVHEKFVTVLKNFKRGEGKLSGYVTALLVGINDFARGVFAAEVVDRLIQTNNEALTRPKAELREEIERYWSLENQAAKTRQIEEIR